MAKRKRGRKASSSSTKKSSSPTPSSTSPTPPPPSSSSTDLTNHEHDSTSTSNLDKKEPAQLILTSVKRNGLYECDYCHTDISQVPRICCAVCTDFDICLECFTTTQLTSTSAGISSDGGGGADEDRKGNEYNQHDAMSHGYKVADSTKYFLFPSLRGVVSIHNENNENENENLHLNANGCETNNPMDGKQELDGDAGQSQHEYNNVKRIKLDINQDNQDGDKVKKNDEFASKEEKVTNSDKDKVTINYTNDDNHDVMDIDVKDDDNKEKGENESVEFTTSMDVDTSMNEENEMKEKSSSEVDIQGKFLLLKN